MTHPEWADHDTAELGRCQTVLADGMHAGLIALDRWHEDLLTDLEAEVTARHTAGGRPRFGRWDARSGILPAEATDTLEGGVGDALDQPPA